MLYLFVTLFLCILFGSVKLDEINIKDSCVIGEIIENNVTRCLCMDVNTYECYSTKNNKTDEEFDGNTENVDTCSAGFIYIQKEATCVCNANNSWPHEDCFRLFGSISKKNELAFQCEPDSYVKYGCNICRCTEKGKIDTSRCTKKTCGPQNDVNNEISSKKCIPNIWYALSACKICYCMESRKLICNNIDTSNVVSQEIGGYSLTMCGEDFLKDTIKLIPVMESVGKILLSTQSDKNDDQDIMVNKKKKINQDPRTLFSETELGVLEALLNNSHNHHQNNLLNIKDVDVNTGSDEKYSNFFEESYHTVEMSEEENSNQLSQLINDLDDNNLLEYFVNSQNDVPTDMRKHVSLKSDGNCVPGETKSYKKNNPGHENDEKGHLCDICFCLKNGKLLCSEKPC